MIGLRRLAGAAALGFLLALGGAAPAAAGDDPWPELRELLFAGRAIQDGAGVIALAAPERAHDAALVPLTIEALIAQTPERYIKTVHLLIDRNPAPLAADLPPEPRQRRRDARDPGADQRVHQRPRDRRDQRRRALHGEPLRQGRGRLLGAGAQGPRAGDRPARPDEAQPQGLPAEPAQPGPAADQPPELQRPADRSAVAQLDPAPLRPEDRGPLRRARRARGRRRHQPEREPLDPLLLRAGAARGRSRWRSRTARTRPSPPAGRWSPTRIPEPPDGAGAPRLTRPAAAGPDRAPSGRPLPARPRRRRRSRSGRRTRRHWR